MTASSFFSPNVSRLAWKVWRRNWDVFFKTYRVNFLPPFLEPVLYLLAIGFGLGLFVGEIDGVPYVEFIAPALIAISIMNSSFFECTYGSFVRMYYMKTFDAMVATPLSIDDVIAGELLWGATRSLIYATIMLIVFALFGIIDLPLSLLIIPFSFAGGLLFAGIGMCFTAITPGINELNYPSFLFITPMFLFSGTFFPLSILPEPLPAVALAVLPLTHLVNITRSLTLSAVTPLFFLSLAWIFIAGLLFFLLSIHLMKRRLVV
ncbi:MAG: ABC transporter permease [Methanomicrobiaceae archaeon]|nr:ABC transporter permease [Methanomicrobiaceae archaeon]